MNLSLRKITYKKPKRLVKFEKNVAKKWNAKKKQLRKRFLFVTIMKRSVMRQLERIGQKIVRISPPWLRRIGRVVWRPFAFMIRRTRLLLGRRPHRSFHLTRRRDYKRSLQLPGYWAFTNRVRAMLWKNRRLFGGLMLTYFIVAFLFNSFGQQETYQLLSDAIYGIGGDAFQGNWGKITASGILLFTSIQQGLTPDATAAQTVLGGLTAFFAWLATVWALRNIMAGHKVRVRDAIYSSGGPILPTVLVGLTIGIQLLPLSLGILIYNAAIASQLISGVEAMLAWVVVALLGILSLYWLVATFIALVVVTLPGMYPWQAIRTAGDLIIGRRLRVLLRLVWLVAIVVVVWVMLLIPVILLDQWIKSVWPVLAPAPLVPLSMLAMSSVTIIFVATYVYMLYRKVVEDDAKPA